MDPADVSLVMPAETLAQRRILTLDRGDLAVCRIKKGHRTLGLEVLGPTS